MKTVKQQIVDFFAAKKLEVEFEASMYGFTAYVRDMVILGEKVDSVLIHWYDSGNRNTLSVNIIYDAVHISPQLRRAVNMYNTHTSCWKALINDDDEYGRPFLSFDCDCCYIQQDRIDEILTSLFDDLADDDNEAYFFELLNSQKRS